VLVASPWEALIPNHFSVVLGVSHEDLDETGAFDGFVDIDSLRSIDPKLLAATSAPELYGAHDKLRRRFRNICRLLLRVKSQNRKDPFWAAAIKLLISHETPNTGIGYGEHDTEGNGIGQDLAESIARTGRAVLDAGIDDPTILELVGILQMGVGADRLSDLIVTVILPELAAYTKRIADGFGARTKTFEHHGQSYQLPFHILNHVETSILLLPKDILRDLPLASDFGNIADVSEHNEQIRNYLNEIIGEEWAKEVKKQGKKDFIKLVLDNPEVLKELLAAYKLTDSTSYDFVGDPSGEVTWYEKALWLAAHFPLSLTSPQTDAEVIQVTRVICEQFKDLVENKGQFELLYDEAHNAKRERASQKLFYGIAHVYCALNNIDVSPESNGGVGPVDFKFSRGLSKTLVEVKMAHGALEHGYEKQLKRYQEAEDAVFCIFLIVRVRESSGPRIERLLDRNRRELAVGEIVPAIVVVDARWQESASRT
jgi:hypothetical protein